MTDEKTENGSSVKNTAGLKPWKSGESGNPKGRPKGSFNITNAIKRKLKEIAPGDSKGREYGELMAESMIVNAIKGNGTAIKEVMARVDGILKETQEHSGNVTLTIIEDKKINGQL